MRSAALGEAAVWQLRAIERKKEKKRRPWHDLLSLSLSSLSSSSHLRASPSHLNETQQQPRAPPRRDRLRRAAARKQQQRRRGPDPFFHSSSHSHSRSHSRSSVEKGRGLDDRDRHGGDLGRDRRCLPGAGVDPELARGPGAAAAGGVRALKKKGKEKRERWERERTTKEAAEEVFFAFSSALCVSAVPFPIFFLVLAFCLISCSRSVLIKKS
jgi:hypothetical protein